MNLLKFIDELGSACLFVSEILWTSIYLPSRTSEVFDQIWRISMASLSTTAMAGFFVGAIMAIQFSMQLMEFSALGYLGGLSTSGTIRAVGPLLIAFMLSGKVGAFTSAELGTMRVTEQLDAIRCLGANPIQEIIVPRFLGILVSSFFLLTAGLMTSILGGMLMARFFAQINFLEYLRYIPVIVTSASIGTGVFKCFVFAIVIASVCTYIGYHTRGGARGVGKSVVSTAVVSMVGLVVADWITSRIAEAVLLVVIEL